MAVGGNKCTVICCAFITFFGFVWYVLELSELRRLHHMKMMEPFIGGWILEENENFDGVLKQLGLNAIQRDIALHLTTYMDIKIIDDEFEIETVTGPVARTVCMKFSVEFEDKSPMGGTMFVSWSIVDDKMIGFMYFRRNNRKMAIERYCKNGSLFEIMTVGNQRCRRKFRRKTRW